MSINEQLDPKCPNSRSCPNCGKHILLPRNSVIDVVGVEFAPYSPIQS